MYCPGQEALPGATLTCDQDGGIDRGSTFAELIDLLCGHTLAQDRIESSQLTAGFSGGRSHIGPACSGFRIGRLEEVSGRWNGGLGHRTRLARTLSRA